MMLRRGLLLLAAGIVLLASVSGASAQVKIGLGTSCLATWTAPALYADALTPLVASDILAYRVYMDPPTSGPVPNVTVPAATLTTTPPATTPPTTYGICSGNPGLSSGVHSVAVSAVTAGGEGGAIVASFTFLTTKPGTVGGLTVK